MITIFLAVKRRFNLCDIKLKIRSQNNSEVVIPIIEPLKNILSEIAAPEEKGAVFPSILKGQTDETGSFVKSYALQHAIIT